LELRIDADLWTFVTKLIDEVKDPEMTRLLGLAGMLHQNFFETSMPSEAVRDHAKPQSDLSTNLTN